MAAALVTYSASASAVTCKSEYYRGFGSSKSSWKTGRTRARADWVERVDGALGWPWSTWARARIKDESCKWSRGTNACVTKAYPCK
jgi:hypothetical protein